MRRTLTNEQPVLGGDGKPGLTPIAYVALASLILLHAGAVFAATDTINFPVSAGADDGFAWGGATQDTTAGYLMVGDGRDYAAPYHMSAMRFIDVNIPRGAPVVAAHLDIRSVSDGTRGQIYGVIQAEAADDAADFSSRYIAAAARTIASVDWDHKTNWATDTLYSSGDLAGVIQEVVDRGGWSPGNSLAVFYSTRADSGKDRKFGSFELGSGYAAVLSITFETYIISGYVKTADAVGMAGVTVSAGAGVGPTVTDGSGYYELTVPGGWTGTVTPAKPDWGFTPTSWPYTNVTSDQTNQDYTGFQPTISGYVTDGGSGVEGVTVSGNNGGGSDVTDSSGYYEITVPHGWTGTITPAKTGWSFTPASLPYGNVTADYPNQNYTGFQPTISGYVTGDSGVSGVTVSANNGGGSDVTDASGYYEITVPYGWSGTVTAAKTGWLLTPANRSYTNVTSDWTNRDYTAFQPTIWGYVTDGADPIEGVSLSADNGGGSDTTDANGYYEIVVAYNWSGTITPSKAGWLITPVNRSYGNVTADYANQNYTGFQPTISGTITYNSAGLEGVTVAADNGGGTDVTNASGYYEITVAYNWSGAVTPAKTNWQFDPNQLDYMNVTSNATGQDYDAAYFGYGGGSGTAAEPFIIATAEHMNEIGAYPTNWDKHFLLVSDIDLAGFTGTQFNVIGIDYSNAFTGVFDGNGRTISNFTYDSNGVDYIGLFGYVKDSAAQIKNLGLIDPNVDARTGDYVGGLIGHLYYNATVSDCYVQGGSISGDRHIGGLVGYSSGLISRCYSTADVHGSNDYVGGLVGRSSSDMVDCYAGGDVSGNSYVGGLVGTNSHNIIRCYSTGGVSGSSETGGLAGFNSDTVISCYWDTQTSGQTTSSGGAGRTTAQMQSADTYINWGDCNDPVWRIDDGNDYPRQIWQGTSGQVICDQISDYLSGNGTASQPYLIYTAEQLNTIGLFGQDWDKHFRLMADIDLVALAQDRFNIIGISNAFTGFFDGNGHTISNFTLTEQSSDHVGLFGFVDDPNAEIRNLGLIDPNVSGFVRAGAGALVGWLRDGSVTNCYVQGGSISGDMLVGGLIGSNGGGSVLNCHSSARVRADNRGVGGLIGSNSDGPVSNCSASGDVSGEGDAGGLIGGIGGQARISNCSASGTVSGYDGIGGLVGRSMFGQSQIVDCSATGDVSGSSRIGGLVGFLRAGSISGSHASGAVSATGDYAGGLVGRADSQVEISECFTAGSVTAGGGYVGGLVGLCYGTISNCYATDDVSGGSYTGGLLGYLSEGSVSGSYASGAVSATGDYVGGLVGQAGSQVPISECFAVGSVTGSGSYVGGLVGQAYWQVSISECFAVGSVTAGGSYVGGLVGWTDWTASISECFAAGIVTGDNLTGGLAGRCGTISNSYATGDVSGGGDGVGGLASSAYEVYNCYSTGSVSGGYPVGGLVVWALGVHDSFWDVNTSGQTESDLGTGRTTAQMQKASTFAAWVCDGPVWTIDDGNDYPKLARENKPGEPLRDLLMYKAGSGTISDPYLIETAEQMSNIGYIVCDWDKHFRMVADINMADLTDRHYRPMGYVACPRGGPCERYGFSGTFDGYGHTIYNFSHDRRTLPSSEPLRSAGLFGAVDGENAEVRNLTLVDPNVQGLRSSDPFDYLPGTGAVVSYLVQGTVSHCRVYGGHIGGHDYIGGLVGNNLSGGNIYRCSVEASNVSGNRYIGGLAGAHQGTIAECYSTASVEGVDEIGGLVGSALFGAGPLSDCYATGDVNGTDRVGGLIGLADFEPGTYLTNCFSAGQVSGTTNVGGFAGDSVGDEYVSCFWDSTVNSGLTGIGSGGDPPNVIGKTTGEMQSITTFTDAGWDFPDEMVNGPNDLWRMCVDGVNYPKLTWEHTSIGDFECPDGADGSDLAAFCYDWLLVPFAGVADFAGGGRVNFADWVVFANAWDSDSTSPHWDPNCDIAPDGGDGVIDGLDMGFFVDNWLREADERIPTDVAPPGGDGIVNMRDYAVLAENWLQGL